MFNKFKKIISQYLIISLHIRHIILKPNCLKPIKCIAWFLILSFSLQQISQAAYGISPTSISTTRQLASNLFDLNIPESMGEVVDSYDASEVRGASYEVREDNSLKLGKDYTGILPHTVHRTPHTNKTIILIEDAHANYSGQMNIAKILKHIYEQQPMDYVFLEAGSGDMSLAHFRDKAKLEHRQALGQNYLHKSLMQGAEYFDLTSTHEFMLWGAENEQLYNQSLEIYREVVIRREATQIYLNKVWRSLEFLQNKLYSPSLLKLKEISDKYEKNQISFIAYANTLQAMHHRYNLDIVIPTSLSHITKLSRLEASIDFELVNQGYQQLLDSQNRTLDTNTNEYQKIQPFKQSSAPFEQQSILKRLLNSSQSKLVLNTQEKKELKKYLNYLEQVTKVNYQYSLDAVSLYSEDIANRLAPSEHQRTLMQLSRNLRILVALNAMQLTSNEYRRLHGDFKLNVNSVVGALNKIIFELGDYQDQALFEDELANANIQKAFEFYDLTHQRDIAFLDEIMKQMNSAESEQSIFITGGFHTDYLKALFKYSGLSYQIIRPNVSEETNHKLYEELLLNQVIKPSTANLGDDTIGLLPIMSGQSRLTQQQLNLDLLKSSGGAANNPITIARSAMQEARKSSPFEAPTVFNTPEVLKNNDDGSRMTWQEAWARIQDDELDFYDMAGVDLNEGRIAEVFVNQKYTDKNNVTYYMNIAWLSISLIPSLIGQWVNNLNPAAKDILNISSFAFIFMQVITNIALGILDKDAKWADARSRLLSLVLVPALELMALTFIFGNIAPQLAAQGVGMTLYALLTFVLIGMRMMLIAYEFEQIKRLDRIELNRAGFQFNEPYVLVFDRSVHVYDSKIHGRTMSSGSYNRKLKGVLPNRHIAYLAKDTNSEQNLRELVDNLEQDNKITLLQARSIKSKIMTFEKFSHSKPSARMTREEPSSVPLFIGGEGDSGFRTYEQRNADYVVYRIVNALQGHAWNANGAAEELGLNISKFNRLRRAHEIGQGVQDPYEIPSVRLLVDFELFEKSNLIATYLIMGSQLATTAKFMGMSKNGLRKKFAKHNVSYEEIEKLTIDNLFDYIPTLEAVLNADEIRHLEHRLLQKNIMQNLPDKQIGNYTGFRGASKRKSEFRHRRIVDALTEANGNISGAAQKMGINRSNLTNLMKELNIVRGMKHSYEVSLNPPLDWEEFEKASYIAAYVLSDRNVKQAAELMNVDIQVYRKRMKKYAINRKAILAMDEFELVTMIEKALSLRELIDMGAKISKEFISSQVKEIIDLQREVYSKHSDQELQDAQVHLIELVRVGGHSLDAVMTQAMALSSEVSKRVLNLPPTEAQLMAAISIHNGYGIEMLPSEGKTLSIALAAHLHALSGKGVHIPGFHDYLVAHDALAMGPLFEFLNLSVGVILDSDKNYRFSSIKYRGGAITHRLSQRTSIDANDRAKELKRKDLYRMDIVYAVKEYIVFDALQDTNAYRPEDRNLREDPPSLIILDEGENTLFHEASEPLVLTAHEFETETSYIKSVMQSIYAESLTLIDGMDYYYDEVEGSIHLIPSRKLRITSDPIYDEFIESGGDVEQLLIQALTAKYLYRKDVDYVVQDNQIIIIDSYTGRLKRESVWAYGLHAMIAIKENADIRLNPTIRGLTTYQNYYRDLGTQTVVSAITGTLDALAEDLMRNYELPFIAIPQSNVSKLIQDSRTLSSNSIEQFTHVLGDVEAAIESGRPVLIGVDSIEHAHEYKRKLAVAGIDVKVVDGQNIDEEIEVINSAGEAGRVTIGTAVIGRGVNIALTKESKANGGLKVIRTFVGRTRANDLQLELRAARRDDPGSYSVHLSLEDSLLSPNRDMFGTKRDLDLTNILQKDSERKMTAALNHAKLYDDVLNLKRFVYERMRRHVFAGAEGFDYEQRRKSRALLIEMSEIWHQFLTQAFAMQNQFDLDNYAIEVEVVYKKAYEAMMALNQYGHDTSFMTPEFIAVAEEQYQLMRIKKQPRAWIVELLNQLKNPKPRMAMEVYELSVPQPGDMTVFDKVIMDDAGLDTLAVALEPLFNAYASEHYLRWNLYVGGDGLYKLAVVPSHVAEHGDIDKLVGTNKLSSGYLRIEGNQIEAFSYPGKLKGKRNIEARGFVDAALFMARLLNVKSLLSKDVKMSKATVDYVSGLANLGKEITQVDLGDMQAIIREAETALSLLDANSEYDSPPIGTRVEKIIREHNSFETWIFRDLPFNDVGYQYLGRQLNKLFEVAKGTYLFTFSEAENGDFFNMAIGHAAVERHTKLRDRIDGHVFEGAFFTDERHANLLIRADLDLREDAIGRLDYALSNYALAKTLQFLRESRTSDGDSFDIDLEETPNEDSQPFLKDFWSSQDTQAHDLQWVIDGTAKIIDEAGEARMSKNEMRHENFRGIHVYSGRVYDEDLYSALGQELRLLIDEFDHENFFRWVLFNDGDEFELVVAPSALSSDHQDLSHYVKAEHTRGLISKIDGNLELLVYSNIKSGNDEAKRKRYAQSVYFMGKTLLRLGFEPSKLKAIMPNKDTWTWMDGLWNEEALATGRLRPAVMSAGRILRHMGITKLLTRADQQLLRQAEVSPKRAVVPGGSRLTVESDVDFKEKIEVFLYGLEHYHDEALNKGELLPFGDDLLQTGLDISQGMTYIRMGSYQVDIESAKLSFEKRRSEQNKLRATHIQEVAMDELMDCKKAERVYESLMEIRDPENIIRLLPKAIIIPRSLYADDMPVDLLENHLRLLLTHLKRVHKKAPEVRFYLDSGWSSYQVLIDELIQHAGIANFTSIAEPKEKLIATLVTPGYSNGRGFQITLAQIQANDIPQISKVIYQTLIESMSFIDVNAGEFDFEDISRAEEALKSRNDLLESPIADSTTYMDLVQGLAPIEIQATYAWIAMTRVPIEYMLKSLQRTTQTMSQSA